MQETLNQTKYIRSFIPLPRFVKFYSACVRGIGMKFLCSVFEKLSSTSKSKFYFEIIDFFKNNIEKHFAFENWLNMSKYPPYWVRNKWNLQYSRLFYFISNCYFKAKYLEHTTQNFKFKI